MGLEEQLELEARERLQLQKTARRNEKRVKEVLMQIEDERRGGELHKEQAEKSTVRIKNLKKQLDEAEEEISKEKGAKRKLMRELEDLNEAYEVLEREVGGYRSKIRYVFLPLCVGHAMLE